MAKKKGKITLDAEACKGCYLCVSVCPEKLIVVSKDLNQKGYYPAEFTQSNGTEEDHMCTGCTTCAIICPDVAIEVYRD